MGGSPVRIRPDDVTAEETRDLAEVVRRKGGILLVDEIYHASPTARRADSRPPPARTSSSSTLLQVFPDDGWRLGCSWHPPATCARSRSCAEPLHPRPRVAQHAALACFEPATIAIVEARRAELDQRRRYLIPALESLASRCPWCRRAPSTSTPMSPRSRPTASPSRATSSRKRVSRSRRARTSATTSPSATSDRLHADVARLEEAIARNPPIHRKATTMTPWIDALLAYLHSSHLRPVRVPHRRSRAHPPPARRGTIRLLGRMDLWFFGAAILVLVTGFLRSSSARKERTSTSMLGRSMRSSDCSCSSASFPSRRRSPSSAGAACSTTIPRGRCRRRSTQDAPPRHGRGPPRRADSDLRGDHVARPRLLGAAWRTSGCGTALPSMWASSPRSSAIREPRLDRPVERRRASRGHRGRAAARALDHRARRHAAATSSPTIAAMPAPAST